MMAVDTHIHIWDLKKYAHIYTDFPTAEHSAIYRNYSFSDYFDEIKTSNVKYLLHVQVAHSVEENSIISQLVGEHSFMAGYIGWVDLANAEHLPHLRKLTIDPHFKGIRHQLHVESYDSAWLENKQVLTGLSVLAENNLVFDAIVNPENLKDIAKPAGHIANLKIVINHCGVVQQRSKFAFKQWCDDMALLARYPNIVCKLSGLAEAIDSTDPATLAPYFHHCLREFGAERCLFGSNWPVCRLTNQSDGNPASIDTIVRLLEDSLESFGLSADDRRLVMRENAVRVYNLQLRPY